MAHFNCISLNICKEAKKTNYNHMVFLQWFIDYNQIMFLQWFTDYNHMIFLQWFQLLVSSWVIYILDSKSSLFILGYEL